MLLFAYVMTCMQTQSHTWMSLKKTAMNFIISFFPSTKLFNRYVNCIPVRPKPASFSNLYVYTVCKINITNLQMTQKMFCYHQSNQIFWNGMRCFACWENSLKCACNKMHSKTVFGHIVYVHSWKRNSPLQSLLILHSSAQDQKYIHV